MLYCVNGKKYASRYELVLLDTTNYNSQAMGGLERGFPQAPIESVTRSKRNLKQSRKEALLALKKQVLAELISDPSELPHWAGPINKDGLIEFSKKNKSFLAGERTKIVKEEIEPRKKFLGIDAFDERQHRYVQNKMAEFAEELGVPVDFVMALTNKQMEQAVKLQGGKKKNVA